MYSTWLFLSTTTLGALPMITPAQVRMARAALGWGVRELSEKAGVATNTVSRFETASELWVRR